MTGLSSRKGVGDARRPRDPKPAKHDLVELTADTVARLRDTISSSVPLLVEQYKADTGLIRLGEQFQVEVIQAIFASVLLHSDTPKRRRRSIVRTRMKAVAKQASALAKQLRSFQAAMDELIPLHRSEIVKGMELPLRAEWAGLKLERIPSFLAQKFDDVSNRAAIYAPMFVDKGGKPLMVEFRALAQGLRHAFERATGRPAT